MTNENHENKTKSELSFWEYNKGISLILILIFTLPISLIIANIYVIFSPGNNLNLGFDMTNSIALLAACMAITGIFYSNFRNDQISKSQMKDANKRFVKELRVERSNLINQMNEERENLNIQIKNSKTLLKEQLEHTEKQLKEQLNNNERLLNRQLEHNEKQLQKQLIFKARSDAILEIYLLLDENRIGIFGEDPKKKYLNNKALMELEVHGLEELKRNARINIFKGLKSMKKDVKLFFYLPPELKHPIDDFLDYVDNSSKKFMGNKTTNQKKTYDMIFFRLDIVNKILKIFNLTQKCSYIEIMGLDPLDDFTMNI